VVIDPFCTNACAKADEWVPIRPGTDGALALGMLRAMIVDLRAVDYPFLRQHTNAPYLIGPDGHYVRDGGRAKPRAWDAAAGEARPFDEVEASAMAWEGGFEWSGQGVRPGGRCLATHLGGVS